MLIEYRRRAMDRHAGCWTCSFAALLLLLVSPLLAIIALSILVTSGRPVLFRQPRISENGGTTHAAKLRTMRSSTSGPEITTASDARITRLGAFLRRTAIDELPQLWHVLRAQMTLVGPRPESATLADRYSRACRSVLLARPGLTGTAPVGASGPPYRQRVGRMSAVVSRRARAAARRGNRSSSKRPTVRRVRCTTSS